MPPSAGHLGQGAVPRGEPGVVRCGHVPVPQPRLTGAGDGQRECADILGGCALRSLQEYAEFVGGIMIILGIILVVVFGFLIPIPVLSYLGYVLIVVGVILLLLGVAGRGIGGRRHYY